MGTVRVRLVRSLENDEESFPELLARIGVDTPIPGLQLTPRGKAHLLARDTVLLAPDAAGKWGTRCPHGKEEQWDSRSEANIAKRNPHNWCDACLAVVGENLDIE